MSCQPTSKHSAIDTILAVDQLRDGGKLHVCSTFVDRPNLTVAVKLLYWVVLRSIQPVAIRTLFYERGSVVGAP